eukprot:m.26783 g.26783  ORF g.26783 m.26783 type:complete len:605 (-) comp11841_c0_seq1:100-1914(-)
MFSFFRRRGGLVSTAFGLILALSLWFNLSYRNAVEHDHALLTQDATRLKSLETVNDQLRRANAALSERKDVLVREIAAVKRLSHGQPALGAHAEAAEHVPVNAGMAPLPGKAAPRPRPARAMAAAAAGGADGTVPAPESVDDCITVSQKQAYIKKMMKVAWDGYHDHAWGYNELDPAKDTFHLNTLFGSNSGATIIDALDTLYLMDMTDELADAREWVDTKLNMDIDKTGSVFELTIRYLGGFLSAYALTKDELYLQKAEDIGSRLVKAFDTSSGIPNALVNLHTGHGEKFGWVRCNCAILSEMGTMQLEFDYLSVITKDPKYVQAVTKAMDLVLKQPRKNGMFPNFVDMNTGSLQSSDYRLGAMGDSFYEYLVKYWRYQGGLDTWNEGRALFDDVYKHVKTHLIKEEDGHMFIGDLAGGGFQARMDHLACFLGGTLMMASQGAKDAESQTFYTEIAVGLTDTCHHAYNRTATGLGPDIMSWGHGHDGRGSGGSQFYWLRPETVESYFYLWRYTKDEKYRDWAWAAVKSIEKHCRCGSGYCGLNDVNRDGTSGTNWHSTQESFFLAETLKYLYLTFSPDEKLPLEDWVFNTEAHPLPVQKGRAL